MGKSDLLHSRSGFPFFLPMSHIPIRVPACGMDKKRTVARRLHAGRTSISGDVIVMLKLHHHVASQRIQNFLEAFLCFFQYVIRYLVVSKKKNLSLAITVCHHSASLVMSIGDPRVGFFYPTLTLMMDSFTVICL